MVHPLESAMLKLDRAREHLDQLDAELQRFLDAQPYAIGIHFDFDAPEHTVVAHELLPPPRRLGLLMGDAIHNTRSALDHLVYELAGLDPKVKRGEKTQFPVCESPPLFDQYQGTYLQGVPTEHRATLRFTQPYNTPYALLRQMARLDDRDKHRVIDPILAVPVDATLRAEPGAIYDVRPLSKTVDLHDKTVLAHFKADHEVSVDYVLRFIVSFGQPRGSRLTSGEARDLIAMARSIVGMFVTAF
jgi:hypothetical protein